MTTTSVFQGIQEGAKLSSRVLKPPGGGSSISFFDDDKNEPSRTSPQPTSPSSTSSECSAAFVVQGNPSAVESPTPSENNGTVLEKVSDQQDSSVSHIESLTLNDVIVNGKSDGVDKCDRANMSKVESETVAESSHTSSLENVNVNGSSVAVLKNTMNGSITNGVHTNGSCVNMNKDVMNGNDKHDLKDNIEESVIINGSPKTPIVPKLTAYQTSTSPLFSHSPASPSMKPNEDTRDRVIGHHSPVNTTPQTAQPRKIKDHMRSSIFMSDEDYTPTRSSRINATVNDSTPENVPAAGQRQRVPPGGFSSKLW